MNIEIVAALAFVFGLLLTISPINIGIFSVLVSSLSSKFGFGHKLALWTNIYIIFYSLGIAVISYLIYQIVLKSSNEYVHGWVVLGILLSTLFGLYLLKGYFLKPKSKLHFKSLQHSIKKSVTNSSALKAVFFTSILAILASLPTLGLMIILFSTISVITAVDYMLWVIALVAAILAVLYFCLFHVSGSNGLTGLMHWQNKHQTSMFAYLGASMILLSWVAGYILLVGVNP